MKHLLIILFAISFIGCNNVTSNDEASAIEEVEATLRAASDFSTDKVTYKAGDIVVLQLENKSNENIGYNLCSAQLEQQKVTNWEIVPSDRMCTAVVYTLEPGKSTTYEIKLDDNMAAGEFRFIAEIHLLESKVKGRRLSNTFKVN